MGPSVKFVLIIIEAFPNQKMGVIFCVGKKDKPRGGLSLGRTFSRLSFLNTSLIFTRTTLLVNQDQDHTAVWFSAARKAIWAVGGQTFLGNLLNLTSPTMEDLFNDIIHT